MSVSDEDDEQSTEHTTEREYDSTRKPTAMVNMESPCYVVVRKEAPQVIVQATVWISLS